MSRRALAYARNFDRGAAVRSGVILYAGGREALRLAGQLQGRGTCLALIDCLPESADLSCLYGVDVTVICADYYDDPRDIVVELLRAGVGAIAVIDRDGIVTDHDGAAYLVDRT